MNKTDFVVNCAKLAGWKVSENHIAAPNLFLFNIEELSTGFITSTKQDDWDLLYYESLLDKALSMVNFNFVHHNGLYEIVTHSNNVIIFDSSGFSKAVFFGEGVKVKEEILHNYFELMAANNG